MRRAIKVALAFVGLLVGAGFASGQEVIQYFLAYGYWGIIGSIIAGIVIVVVGASLFQLGSYYLADDHSAVFHNVTRPMVSKFMDYSTMATLFCIGFVMIAGAGSNLEQQFGFPTWVGAAIMTVLLLLSGLLDIDKLTSVISIITPFLIFAVLAALFITILNMPDNISAINELSKTNDAASGVFNNWLISALNYASLCIIMAVSMILVIAGSQLNPREAGIGGVIGGMLFASLLAILVFIIFMNMEGAIGTDFPLLAVFNNMHPVVGVVVSVVIYLMVYNTSVGMFYAMARRLAHNKPGKFRKYYFIAVLIGFGLSFIGFSSLVGWVYPVLGYLGMALIVIMVGSWIKERATIKKESKRRERLSELAETALDTEGEGLSGKDRSEVEDLVGESNLDDSKLWHTVQEEKAAELDSRSESDFSLDDNPALDPDHKDYSGAPGEDSDPIDWKAYEEMYETGSFPAVKPEDTKKK